MRKFSEKEVRVGDAVILFGGIPHVVEKIAEDFWTGKRLFQLSGCFGWYRLRAENVDGVEPKTS